MALEEASNPWTPNIVHRNMEFKAPFASNTGPPITIRWL